MNENIFQEIYDELEKYLSNAWEKLIVYLEYGKASYSFSFFVKEGERYIKCFDLPNIDEEALMQSFRKIDKAVSKERDSAKEPWSNMTMIVGNDGSMHTDFDYTDLSQEGYRYNKEWKLKYLK